MPVLITIYPDRLRRAAVASGQAPASVTLIDAMLSELRTIVARTRPTNAVFRTNHASNYLPLSGRLPEDRERIVETIDVCPLSTI